MNKKILYGLMLPLFAVVLVIAGAVYYNATINVTADITEPFVTTTIPLSFSGFATEIMTKNITVENKAEGELPATITWLPRSDLVVPDMMSITNVNGEPTSIDLLIPSEEGKIVNLPNGVNTLTVSFSSQGANIGALNLAKKDVDFTKNVWDVLEEGEIGWQPQVTMEYSKIGDKFTAEVVTEDQVDDYVLIYYKDNRTNIQLVMVQRFGMFQVMQLMKKIIH